MSGPPKPAAQQQPAPEPAEEAQSEAPGQVAEHLEFQTQEEREQAAERARRIEVAKQLVADAEARGLTTQQRQPPSQQLALADLYTVGPWAHLEQLICKLCPFSVLMHEARSKAQAEEELFQHFLHRHLGISEEEEE